MIVANKRKLSTDYCINNCNSIYKILEPREHFFDSRHESQGVKNGWKSHSIDASFISDRGGFESCRG